ncbi:hypothetical protein SELMODRAFT_404738 [Selaginella moellendorffii]|uniref:Uncharacterized protein n=1 Tax=Selaginella moellendorffii TaxID=88036 RepID=D8QW86_SELML|nr:hypothetical protein SELMODRAFT_404738 [Selaginella moellendorffii]
MGLLHITPAIANVHGQIVYEYKQHGNLFEEALGECLDRGMRIRPASRDPNKITFGGVATGEKMSSLIIIPNFGCVTGATQRVGMVDFDTGNAGCSFCYLCLIGTSDGGGHVHRVPSGVRSIVSRARETVTRGQYMPSLASTPKPKPSTESLEGIVTRRSRSNSPGLIGDRCCAE